MKNNRLTDPKPKTRLTYHITEPIPEYIAKLHNFYSVSFRFFASNSRLNFLNFIPAQSGKPNRNRTHCKLVTGRFLVRRATDRSISTVSVVI